ncbi:tail fiber domain-containing protein [bacterium]|nr:tail fiber domain-containing protein [bacterium]
MYKMHKAFSLAELMVIMSVLTILMAAFAPIITSRYTNSSTDSVWSTVSDDSMHDIYSDGASKDFYQASFIGMTPNDGDEIRDLFQYTPAKLLIRSSNKINQPQIEFKYGGSSVGNLYSAYDNILFGAEYNLSSNIKNNTSIGRYALNNIPSSSENNVAIGYKAVSDLFAYAKDSVFVGNELIESSPIQNSIQKSVAIGHNISDFGSNNVAIGNDINIMNNSGESNSGYQYNGVAIGFNSKASGDNNVALGNFAYADGMNNVAIGYKANQKPSSFSNTTAIGNNSCNAGNGNNRMCIGADGDSDIYNDDVDRVFIGKDNSSHSGGALEVHNLSGKNATVVINGDLVVRGQPFMLGNSHFDGNGNYSTNKISSLMGYYLIPTKTNQDFFVLAGEDGNAKSRRLDSSDDINNHQKHMKFSLHETCICSSLAATQYADSYDWTSLTSGNYDFYDYIKDNAVFSIIYNNDNSEFSKAHNDENGSCCPDLSYRDADDTLSSDARLKDIGPEFKDGLKYIEKLKFYNYTFKADKSKVPHVGVIAQSLKKVFPESVFKDEKGYYKIRWDEMFYASINSVKELNQKTNDLISRVEKDIKRVEKLKNDNRKLKNKLIELSNELDELEKLQ